MAHTRDFTLGSYAPAENVESGHKAAMTIAVIAHRKSGSWSVDDRREAKMIIASLGLIPAAEDDDAA